MVTVEQCATFAKLAPNELFLGAPPSTRHRALLSFYLQDLGALGPQQVREIIVADIRVALSLGAVRQAADLLIVLREFFSLFPEASLAAEPAQSGRHPHHPLPSTENRSKLSSRRTRPARGSSSAPRRLA
ncbi:MAG: hypothetical protein ACLPSW_25345 [Roseiarcus sp.]